MSPEYRLVANKNTEKPEIECNLLEGEDKLATYKCSLAASVATSFLKRSGMGDYQKGVERLKRFLPEYLSKALADAFRDNKENTYVRFRMSEKSGVKITDTSIIFNSDGNQPQGSA